MVGGCFLAACASASQTLSCLGHVILGCFSEIRVHLPQYAHDNIGQLNTGLSLGIRKTVVCRWNTTTGNGHLYEAVSDRLPHVQDVARISKDSDSVHVKKLKSPMSRLGRLSSIKTKLSSRRPI
jgi:hypothetical protein